MVNNQKSKLMTVLITGATSGIGYELSKIFAQNGYNLVLVARNTQRLEHIAKDFKSEYNVKVEIISKDLSLTMSPEEIFDELQVKSIHIDILVNNAGFNEYGPFFKTDIKKELQMIQVNIVSLVHLTKLFLPDMLKYKYGKILNVGSTGSFTPGPLNAVYCATKAYVLSFSDAIAEELEGTDVTVTTLCPGPTKTEFAQRARIEDTKLFSGSIMDPGKVAEIGYKALMERRRIAIAGIANRFGVFSLRFIPRNALTKIVKSAMNKKTI